MLATILGSTLHVFFLESSDDMDKKAEQSRLVILRLSYPLIIFLWRTEMRTLLCSSYRVYILWQCKNRRLSPDR